MLKLFSLIFFIAQCQCRRLKVVTVDSSPFYTASSAGGYEGFLVDLMNDLIDRANDDSDQEISYRFHLVHDGKYGTKSPSGRWDGMIGEVVQGDADMAVAPITVNTDRMEVVYFSHPFMSVVIVPLIKKPEPGAHMPFKNFTYFISNLQSGHYAAGYIQHGSTEQFIRHHKTPEIRSIYNISKAAHTENPYVDNYEEGIAKVRRSGGRFFFFGEHLTFAQVVNARPCDVMIDWKGSLGVRYYGFVFPKTQAGRHLMERFNQLIVAAQEDGTLANLENKWLNIYKQGQCPQENMCMCHEQN